MNLGSINGLESESSSGASLPKSGARKILIITLVPSHPTDHGNRSRLFRMVSALIDQGHEVHYLYIHREPSGDIAQMLAFWGDRLVLFDWLAMQKPTPATGVWDSVIQRVSLARIGLCYQLNKLLRRRMRVDDQYDDRLNPIITALHSRHRFDVVMVQYFFLTKALTLFDETVTKVVDTIDAFALRARNFRKRGATNDGGGWPISTNEERKGLQRADYVIGIQEEECRYFRSLSLRGRVVLVGHLTAIAKPVREPPEQIVLFVASDNWMNQEALEWYLRHAHPVVRERVPESQLWLCGNVGKTVAHLPDNVRVLGYVPDLSKIYPQAAVVINPVQFGSGLAIKTIDALVAGRALVSTSCGVRGLGDHAGQAFELADDPVEFGLRVAALLADPARRMSIAAMGRKLATNLNEQSLNELAAVITANN